MLSKMIIELLISTDSYLIEFRFLFKKYIYFNIIDNNDNYKLNY